MSVRETDKIYQCHTQPPIILKYVLRITSRARKITIKIREDGLITAVVPEFLTEPEKFIEEFIEKNEKTLLQKLSEIQNRRNTGKAPHSSGRSKVELRVENGQSLLLYGVPYTAVIRYDDQQVKPANMIRTDIFDQDRKVIFFMSAENSDPSRTAGAAWEASLKQKLMEEVERYYESQKIQQFLKQYHVQVRQFTPRTMKGLWGSCTPQRQTIRLNTLLAQLPLKYLHYVMDHEMVHLIEANHQKRFYSLLRRLNSDADQISSEMNRMTVCMDGQIRVK